MLTIGEEEEEEEVLCTRIDEKLGDVFSPPESHIDIDRGPPMRLAQQSRQTNESCGSMAIFDEFLLRIGGVSHESSSPPQPQWEIFQYEIHGNDSAIFLF